MKEKILNWFTKKKKKKTRQNVENLLHEIFISKVGKLKWIGIEYFAKKRGKELEENKNLKWIIEGNLVVKLKGVKKISKW